MVLEKLKNIEVVCLDVDGVLTNGDILVTENGDQLRTFNVKDGYAIQYAIKQGLKIFVITGARSLGVQKRFESLGATEVFLGISDKMSILEGLQMKYNFNYSSCLFIGDDMPDYECMKLAGVAICPADAVEEIKSISHFVSNRVGGKALVREVLEKILKIKGQWHPDTRINSI